MKHYALGSLQPQSHETAAGFSQAELHLLNPPRVKLQLGAHLPEGKPLPSGLQYFLESLQVRPPGCCSRHFLA
jgi:hypothetical protein